MADDLPSVSSYSGLTYAERPTSLAWHGIEHTARLIHSAWLEPGQRHFLVEIEDGRQFHLAYDEAEDRWFVSPAK